MAQRDYVGRSKTPQTQRNKSARGKNKKKQPKKGVSSLFIILSVGALALFASGLWFISHHKKDNSPVTLPHKKAGSGLPPKPEERWKYIKELENRQVIAPSSNAPVASSDQTKQSTPPLTDEQRQLLSQMAADMQQQPTQLSEVPWNQQAPAQQQTRQLQNLRKSSPDTNKIDSETGSRTKTATPPFTHAPTKPATVTQAPSEKSSPKTTSKQQPSQQWLIQCGSFKGSSQAESVRAALAFEGFESRVSVGNGWNRVIIGPYHDAKKVESIANKLRQSGHSSCITRNIKG